MPQTWLHRLRVAPLAAWQAVNGGTSQRRGNALGSGPPRPAKRHSASRARWRVVLRHARGGHEGAWIMEATMMEATGEATADDAANPLRFVGELAGAAPAPDRRRLAG